MIAHLHIGGITIQTFGIFFALNFISWGLVAAKRLGELGKPPDWAYEIVVAAVLGGLIGARAYYLIQNHGSLHGSLLGNVFGGSGLVWYGGLLGGTIAVLLWARWRGFLSLQLVDIAAIGLPLGYAIGRIGCQLSGDGDYGIPWDGPWAMAYPHGTDPTKVPVQPTPVYETLAMGLGAWILWRLRDRVRAGCLFALYLMYAGTERFLVEFLRRNTRDSLGLTTAQLESLAMLAVGALWIAIVVRRHGGIGRPSADESRDALQPAV